MALMDPLLDRAKAITKGNVFADVKITDYGWSVVVYDSHPEEITLDSGREISLPCGEIITAGFGATLEDAVRTAEMAVKGPTIDE